MGHLNSFSGSGGGKVNKTFQKFKCPGWLPGGGRVVKLRFDRYIIQRVYCDDNEEDFLRNDGEVTYLIPNIKLESSLENNM